MAKQHLIENFSKDWGEPLQLHKLALNESANLVEANGKKYSVKEGYEVPVWRLGKKNLNNRIYTESLAKKVVKESKDLVTSCLADHPTQEGSVKDILAVAKNPHIREGILYVDSYIVDEAFGKKLNKMHEAGYGLGVSSSCYGELNESTGEVIEEGFEVERFFDFVISPSYEVYVTEDCKITESTNEKLTIKTEETLPMSDKFTKLTEKTLRLNLEKMVLEAEQKASLQDKVKALNEVLSYTDEDFLSDMKTSISEKITSLNEEVIKLAEKGLTADKLTEDIATKETEKTEIQESYNKLLAEKEDLQKKFDLATTLLDETKAYANNAVDVIEQLKAESGSKFTAQEYLEALESREASEKVLNEKISTLSKSLTEATEKISTLREKVKTLRSMKDTLTEKLDKARDKIIEMEVLEPEDDLVEDDGFDYESSDMPSNVGLDVIPEGDELELDLDNDEVEDYYDDLVDEDPRFESVKKEILRCKTLIEAQRTAMRLRDLIESQPTLKRKAIKKVDPFVDQRMTESARDVDVRVIKHKGWL
jgi:hypothetical protein